MPGQYPLAPSLFACHGVACLGHMIGMFDLEGDTPVGIVGIGIQVLKASDAELDR